MIEKITEKKLLLAWAAFFGFMYVPFVIAHDLWTGIIDDENVTDALAFIFLVATSYLSFRMVVTKVILNRKTEQKEDDSCFVQIAEIQ